MKQTIDLTDAEWTLMEQLWQSPGSSGRGLTEALAAQTGWSRSTTLTLLRRLLDKGPDGAAGRHARLFSNPHPRIRRAAADEGPAPARLPRQSQQPGQRHDAGGTALTDRDRRIIRPVGPDGGKT